MERPIGRRWDLKRVKVTNAMAFDRSGGGQHCAMCYVVVYVKIGEAMRENRVGSMFANQFLHDFNHVENRESVETIVRQFV